MIICAIIITLWITNKNSAKGNPEEDIPEALIPKETETVDKADQEVEEVKAVEWMVDVKGAVKNPSVYSMEEDARVIDAIHLAGGFTKEADQNMVNLAEKITDEMVIYVAEVGDEHDVAIIPQANAAKEENGLRINDATKEEIETLNGIGPSKADAIIAYRDEHGPFQTVDEILKVSGIGEKTLANFQDDIILP